MIVWGYQLNAPYAYLFGSTNGIHDKLNSWAGPEIGQIFPDDLYQEVLHNLTDPTINRAILHNVPVLENVFFGIEPYTIETLMIISNGPDTGYTNAFGAHTEEVRAHTSPLFPDQFPASFSTVDVNMLCSLGM